MHSMISIRDSAKMFVYLSICLTISLSIYLFEGQLVFLSSIFLFVKWSVHLSVYFCLFVGSHVYLFVLCLLVDLSIYLVCLSIYLFVNLSSLVCFYLSICLSSQFLDPEKNLNCVFRLLIFTNL